MLTSGPLPFTPTHLEDETLYSYLYRVNAYNCAGASRTFVHQVFGNSKAVTSADLPSGLGTMLQAWEQVSPYLQLEEVIEKTTQFPYHRPFMSRQRWDELVKRALTGSGSALKTWLGLVAQRFSASCVFRSCVHCDRESWCSKGVIYWHRSHLLPGVRVCPTHHIPLVEHFTQSKDSARSALRHPPAPGIPARIAARSLESASRFATSSAELLAWPPLHLGPEACASVYVTRLDEMGLCHRGRVRWQELSLMILEANNGFDCWTVGERVTDARDGVLSWLPSLIQARGSASHPLTHILLIDVLFGSFAGFLSTCKPEANFAEGSKDGAAPRFAAPPLECPERSPAAAARRTSLLSRRQSWGHFPQRPKPAFKKVARASDDSFADRLAQFRSRWLATASPGRTVRQRYKLDRYAAAWLYRHDHEWITTGLGSNLKCADAQRSRVDWPARDRDYVQRLRFAESQMRVRTYMRRISVSQLIRATGPESTIRANLYRLPLYRQELVSFQKRIGACRSGHQAADQAGDKTGNRGGRQAYRTAVDCAAINARQPS